MADLTGLTLFDPTLDAVDAALEKREREANQVRGYLGASGIGHPCERSSWLSFRWASDRTIPAQGLRAIQDGFRAELTMIERLKMVPGIDLWVDGENGRQIGFSSLGGHFRGNLDGIIRGLLQDPETFYVWEHKCVNLKKFELMKKLKDDVGEGRALEKWDPVYYTQAQLYMHHLELKKHYMTIDSPGSRATTSCITEYDPAFAERVNNKAKRIIFNPLPPARIKEDAAWYECRFCAQHATCQLGVMPNVNCRTCTHSTPKPDGTWVCEKFSKTLSMEEQAAGCVSHRYLPDLVKGTVVDVVEGDRVIYDMPDGTQYTDGDKP